MFIDTVPKKDAAGLVREIYDEDEARWGYLPNFTQLFSLHPEAYRAWLELITAIRGQMDLRRCELATVAAARTMKSTACTVAHSKMLRDRFYETEQVIQIATNHRHAGLADVDVAIMDFAEKVAETPSEISREEVERLKSLGLSDRDILDIVLSVAARAFFTTVVDALGSPVEEQLVEDLEPELLEVLIVGRPLQPT